MSESATPWQKHLSILWAGQLSVSLGLTGTAPFIGLHMARLTDDGGAVLLWASLAMAGPSLAYMLTTPLWGKLSDRMDRKWSVVRALSGLAACMIGMALSTNAATFLVFRLLQGALGGISDASLSWIAASVPPDRRGEAIGIYQQASLAGSLGGPLLGGFAMALTGEASMLFFTAFLAASCACASACWLPKGRNVPAKKRDRRGESGIADSLAVFWRMKELRVMLTAGALTRGMTAALAVLLPLTVSERFGGGSGTSTLIGMHEAAGGFGALIGSSYWGKRSDLGEGKKMIRLSSLMGALAILLQAASPVYAMLLPFRAIHGFYSSAISPIVLGAITRESGQDSLGVRIGTANSVLVFGQFAGSFIPAALRGISEPSFAVAAVGLMPLAAACTASHLNIRNRNRLFTRKKGGNSNESSISGS